MPNDNDPSLGSNAPGSDTPESQFVTEDRIAAVVNAAVSSHLKRSLGSAIAAVLSKELEPIKQRLAEAPKEPEVKEDAKKPSPELVALQKQLADMQSALRAKDEEAQQERRRAREEKAFNELVGELSGKVRPGTEKMVAKLLKADGRLVIDDDGNASLKVLTSLSKGMPEEDHEFPISDGIPHFLKTKDASVFLPPPNPGGAGGDRRVPAKQSQAQIPRYDAPAISEEEKAQRTAEQFAAMGLSLADL